MPASTSSTTSTTRTYTEIQPRTYTELEPADPTQNRHYPVIGAIIVVGLVLATGLALFGLAGPGILSSESAFLGLGLCALVLAFGLVYVLFTLRNNQSEFVQHQKEFRALRTTVHEDIASRRRVSAGNSTGRTAAEAHARAVRSQGVMEIEGIGPVYANKLNEKGVYNIAQLCDCDADEMAPKIGTNATTLRQWQSMGELMQVDGIGKQYAELLVRCGVDSVETLRKSNPESLLAKINKVEGSREVRIQGSSISLDRVKSWISAAGDLQLVTA